MSPLRPHDGVMDLLKQARPASLDPEPDQLRREHDLNRILASAAADQAPRARSGRRIAGMPARRFGYGLGFAAAAAAAVAVVVSSTAGPTTPSRPIAEPATPSGPTAGPTTGPSATPLGAGQILLMAADQAAKAPPASGRYWVAKTTFEALYQTGPASAPYQVRTRNRDDTWTARSASGTSWYIGQYLGTAPVTAADQAAWVKAGSPTSWKVTDFRTLTLDAARLPAFGNPSNSGSAVFALGGHNVTVKNLQSLPGDTAKLKALLLRYFHNGGAGGELPTAPNAWLFEVGAGMLSMPIKPEVRAATYRMMAALPGVRSLGSTKDIDGRTGNGVAIQETDRFGVVQDRVIIDPATGLPLAQEYVYQKANGARSWLTPNDVWYAQVYQSLGWTNDSPPKVPASK
jgi:hypothetical protein